MDEKNGKNPFLALTVATVLFAALGVILYTQAPYKDVRPPVPEFQESSETIRARLWQDPFQAVLDHVKAREGQSKQTKRDHKPQDLKKETEPDALVSGVIDFRGCCNLKTTFINEIFVRQKKGTVTVLAVMVLGGPYAEPVESRLRQRYAVLSGLNRMNFYPEDSERIGCLKILNNKDDHELNLSNIIPFEWLSKNNRKEFILLLWLNEDSFYIEPLGKLSCFKNTIQLFNIKGNFKIIGPPSSSLLLEMIKENKETDLEIYKATATADIDSLTAEAEKYLDKKVEPTKFLNKIRPTICSDKQLIIELIAELDRRGVNVVSAGAQNHDHLVLVGEWDTVYGRLLPETFKEVIREKSHKRPGEEIPWVHRFSYMRGIDGKLPGESNGSAREQKKDEAKNKDDQALKKLEEPVGKSQYDYLRRLAERICRLDDHLKHDNKGSIKAIGVLGNDFYDKYLVLQALGQRLPDRIFFTTDLEALYSHPAHIEWTRNLVVASTYDLQLREDLQGEVPPFRDAYQTSTFAATLRALNFPRLKENDFENLQPHVFEIGRRNAVDLTERCTGGTINSGLKPLNIISGKEVPVIVFFAVILCIIIYLYCISLKNAIYLIVLICFAALYFSLIAKLFLTEEPLLIIEGITVWPTFFLQIIAFALSFLFVVESVKSIRINHEELSVEFFNKSIKNNKKVNSVYQIWINYIKKEEYAYRWFFISVLSVVYLIISCLLIRSFGRPFTPLRGIIFFKNIPLVHIFILFPALFSFYLMTFFVVYIIRLCRYFIIDILKNKPSFDTDSLKQFGVQNGLNEISRQTLSDLMLIRLVARRTEVVGKLIFYPFIILFLLLISRLFYFDKWHTPLGLAIVISMSAFLAWICAVILRRSAETLRADVLSRLENRLTKVYAGESLDQTEVERIQYVLREVKDINSGAFAPYLQQPVWQSLLVPVGGLGGIKIIEFLAKLG